MMRGRAVVHGRDLPRRCNQEPISNATTADVPAMDVNAAVVRLAWPDATPPAPAISAGAR